MMNDQRSHFHEELAALEQTLVDMSERAAQAVNMAVEAVVTPDLEAAARVLQTDVQIDRLYFEVHNRWLLLMARQQPMASDLRLMSAMLHLNTTIERMGDQAVNIAKMAQVTHGLPRSERIVSQIRELGDLVRPMVRTAMEAFVRRDLDETRLLPAMDEPIDRINRRMAHEVVACRDDPELLEWATRMLLVSRALERIGDQSVDIAEQTAFYLTGELAEFDEKGLGGVKA
ncbi:MAG TPA: phosphate signaling complex protein PhoU [Acidimicrobiia bacterium]|jgi:phosphate transport system protein